MQRTAKTILWTVIVSLAIAGGAFAGPAGADDVASRKLALVERFGLNPDDPLVLASVEEANAVVGVDVQEDLDGITIAVDYLGQPEHRAAIFEGRRRYVLDLFDTLNLSDDGPWDLGPDSPVRAARHSQFQIQPDYISRIVCDLAPGVSPELREEPGRLVIYVPYADQADTTLVAAAPASAAPAAPAAPDEPLVMEPMQVEAVDQSDFAVAEDAAPAEPAAADAPATDTDPERTPWWLKAEDAEAPAAQEPAPEPAAAPAAPAPEAKEDLVKVVTDAMSEPTSLDEPAMEEAPAEPAEPAVAEPVEDAAPAAPAAVAEAPAAEPVAEETLPAWLQDAPPAEPVDVAMAEPVEEPLMEEVSPAAEQAEEPARVEVEETIETPSMMEVKPPAPKPMDQPVVVEEPEEPGPMVEPPPLVQEPTLPKPAPTKSMGEQPIASALKGGPGLSASTTSPEALDQRVTLTFRDADLNAVLDIVARKAGINVLAGRDVSGTVTVRLVDVPLDIALDAILNVNGYGYIKTNNIYRIVPLSQIGGDEVETVTEAFELSYADASDVEDTLSSFLTRNGSIQADKRTNMLIVTDVPQAVQRIANLIPQIDRRVQQVLIEVVILDSVLSDGSDLGVQWHAFDKDDNSPGAVGSRTFPFVNGGTKSKAGAVSTLATSLQDGFGINLPSAAPGVGIGVRFGTLLGDFNVSAFVEASVSNSNARVLANPKLLTLDNTTANIDIIEEIPFQDITQTSSGGQLSNISFKEVGTKLEVTPQITNDGYCILEIAPEQSSRIGDTVTGVPIVATRRAQTTLLVQDHQTVVLGGLRISSKTLTRTKVPGLGDVPAVKLLFRSTSKNDSDTEILVFLTIHIVESPTIRPHERLVYEELANMPRQPESQPALWR